MSTRPTHSRLVARLAMSLLAAVAIAAAGCGDGEETTVTETTTATTGDTTSTSASGPEGVLADDALGSVSQGTSSGEAEEVFGAADRSEEFEGCELDLRAAPVLRLEWDLPDGTVSVDFDAKEDEMTSYRTTSPTLATESGIRVGDPYAALRQSYAGLLEPLNIGSATATARSGLWIVSSGPRTELLFDVRGGEIKSIAGGYLPICE